MKNVLQKLHYDLYPDGYVTTIRLTHEHTFLHTNYLMDLELNICAHK